MARTFASNVVRALEDGTYFVEGEVPTGAFNGINVTYTLAETPNPATSLRLFLNGQLLKAGAGNDYTLSGYTITLATAYNAGEVSSFLADYRVIPV